WAPLALTALLAAIRAFAAFAAAALPVVLADFAADWTCVPPSAALIRMVSRDFRRAAAFGWIAPALAARSRAESASTRAWVPASDTRAPALARRQMVADRVRRARRCVVAQ